MTQLQSLEVGGPRSPTPVCAARRITQLQSLQLMGSKVSDAGLQHLKGLTQLQRLDLEGTQVSDAGLKDLAGLAQLQTLGLKHTKVTDEGVAKLQRALPKCKIQR